MYTTTSTCKLPCGRQCVRFSQRRLLCDMATDVIVLPDLDSDWLS